ncbi:hypothetical protein [Bacillus solitudinis]|uniref:hypothetical protein n=1 Tax=Bacillus solitudinis TaxID=2014074 RepID=UPI000C238EEF|nr:hypothetical protein [Bacillus solitudinis]
MNKTENYIMNGVATLQMVENVKDVQSQFEAEEKVNGEVHDLLPTKVEIVITLLNGDTKVIEAVDWNFDIEFIGI